MSASDQEENDYDIYKPATNGDEEANTSTDSDNHNRQDLLTNEEFQVTNAIVELPEGRHRYKKITCVIYYSQENKECLKMEIVECQTETQRSVTTKLISVFFCSVKPAAHWSYVLS